MGKVSQTQSSNPSAFNEIPTSPEDTQFLISECQRKGKYVLENQNKLYTDYNSGISVVENRSPNIYSAVRTLPLLQPRKPPNYMNWLRCRLELFLHISELHVCHLQLTKDHAYSYRAFSKFGRPTKAVPALQMRQVI